MAGNLCRCTVPEYRKAVHSAVKKWRGSRLTEDRETCGDHLPVKKSALDRRIKIAFR